MGEAVFLYLGLRGWDISWLGKSGSLYWLSNLDSFYFFSYNVYTGCKNIIVFCELLLLIIDNSNTSFLLISRISFRNRWHSDCVFICSL